MHRLLRRFPIQRRLSSTVSDGDAATNLNAIASSSTKEVRTSRRAGPLFLQRPLTRFQDPLSAKFHEDADQQNLGDAASSSSTAPQPVVFESKSKVQNEVMKNRSYFTEQVRWHKALCCLLEDKIREEFPQLKAYAVAEDEGKDLSDNNKNPSITVRRQQYGRVYPGSSTHVNVDILQQSDDDEGVLVGQEKRKHKRQYEPHVLDAETLPRSPVEYQCSLTINMSDLSSSIEGFTTRHAEILAALAQLPTEPLANEEHTHRPYEEFLMDPVFHPLQKHKQANSSPHAPGAQEPIPYQMAQSVVHSAIETDAHTDSPVLKLWTMRFPTYEQNRQYLHDTLRNMVSVAMVVEQAQPELVSELLSSDIDAKKSAKTNGSKTSAFKVPKVDKYTAEELAMDFPDEWKQQAKAA